MIYEVPKILDTEIIIIKKILNSNATRKNNEEGNKKPT